MQIDVHANLQCRCSFATRRMITLIVRCEDPNYFRFAVVIAAVMLWIVLACSV